LSRFLLLFSSTTSLRFLTIGDCNPPLQERLRQSTHHRPESKEPRRHGPPPVVVRSQGGVSSCGVATLTLEEAGRVIPPPGGQHDSRRRDVAPAIFLVPRRGVSGQRRP